MQEQLITRAKELLADGTVSRIAGWRKGEFDYDLSPSCFTSAEDLEHNFIYNEFSASNLSKYMIALSKKDGKTLVFLKPCDTYSFQQLVNEHRIQREKVYIIGIPCNGNVDIVLARQQLGDGILSMSLENGKITCNTLYGTKEIAFEDLLLERCRNCKSQKHVIYDELIGPEGKLQESHRFDEVDRLEAMTSKQRFGFWKQELSKCIRCNACRNVCPACSCEKCVFDNPDSGFQNKAASVQFEDDMFHIIRAFHVAGRCTDCGECSRVCPEHIPLHLLNRKFIKDINALYGTYQAGAIQDSISPLTSYTTGDADPSIITDKGEEA
ncbi:MAG: 4Fe-4S dicluster domain-containing protein [Spirochaetia bacterium]|jgi:ferredoxin|nr:4Fe-4S dicluster domain-containing protein [Spirochaetia bacterium]